MGGRSSSATTPKESAFGTAEGHMRHLENKCRRTSSDSSDTAGRATSQGYTRRRGIAAAAEVVTSTVDRPCSTSIKVDAGITYRAKETDMVISIAVARTMGA